MTLLEYDPLVPEKLKKTQQWFGSIIGRRIDENSHINPVAPSGRLIETEARQYIKPGPKLKSHQRIEIYNQQYWWRLLSCLQDIYPLVTRLFGYYGFNEAIATPFLESYPPNHWSLNILGDRLPQWIKENYREKDKQFVYDAALIDFAFNHAFLVGENKPIAMDQISNGDFSVLLEKKLVLQPHVHLFSLGYELFAFRHEMIKQDDGDYWIDHDFPELKKGAYFTVLFRTLENDIGYEAISEIEYLILREFQRGSSIDAICETLEQPLSEAENLDLGQLFRKWVLRKWLSLANS